MDGETTFNAILLLAMGTALVLAMVSQAMQNRFVASEPMLALAAGVAFGPFGCDAARLGSLAAGSGDLLEQLARLTLSLSIITAALRIGSVWMRRHWRDLVLILLLGLPLMALLSFAALWLSIGAGIGGGALELALIAAILAPTDPVLAQAVTTSMVAEKNVPHPLRHLIAAESAANDGLAYPLVMLPLLMIDGAGGYGLAVLDLVAWEVVAAALGGFGLGAAIGMIMHRFGESWVTESAMLTISVAFAFAGLAAARLLGMDGLIAVFGIGTGLSATIHDELRDRHAGFSHTIARLFHLPLLVLLGLALPLDGWRAMGWPLAAAVVLVLLIRRLPILLLLKPWLRSVGNWPGAIFAGWFGPIGIAALFYALLSYRGTGDPTAFVIASAVITGSIVVHGLTDTLGAKWLGRIGGGTGRESRVASCPVPRPRVR